MTLEYPINLWNMVIRIGKIVSLSEMQPGQYHWPDMGLTAPASIISGA